MSTTGVQVRRLFLFLILLFGLYYIMRGLAFPIPSIGGLQYFQPTVWGFGYRLPSILVVGAIILLAWWLISGLTSRGETKQAVKSQEQANPVSTDADLRELLQRLDRMEERMMNLETILIDRTHVSSRPKKR